MDERPDKPSYNELCYTIQTLLLKCSELRDLLERRNLSDGELSAAEYTAKRHLIASGYAPR